MTWQLSRVPGQVAHGATALARPMLTGLGHVAKLLPWWGWAGIGAGSLFLIGGTAAAAEASGGGEPPLPPKPDLPPAPPAHPSVENPFGLSDDIGEREGQILALVESGSIDHQFMPLTWTAKGHTVTALVSRRALALSDGQNRLPVSISFVNTQKAADMLGAALLTTRMADEIQRQAALKLPSMDHLWQGPGTDESGAKTFRLLDQGKQLDSKVGSESGLVSNEGKDWVLTRRWWPPPEGVNDKPKAPEGAIGSPHNAANFGFYSASSSSKSPGGMGVKQSIGLVHNRKHVDYSQMARFVKLYPVTIDGQDYSLADALADPALSGALQDEGGTIPAVRHPDL